MIFKRKWEHTRLWVELVYRSLEWIDYRIRNKLSSILAWRFSFLDEHCWCEQCEKRRAGGYQAPLKGRRPVKPVKG